MGMSMDESDREWRRAQEAEGWSLPEPAWRVSRLWGIRHVRWLIDCIIVHREASTFARLGLGTGEPHPYDLWVLWAVRRGWV